MENTESMANAVVEGIKEAQKHPIERSCENMKIPYKGPLYKELVPFVNTIRKQQQKYGRDFTANVSHEMQRHRSTAISGYAELIENHMVDPAAADCFASANPAQCAHGAAFLLSMISSGFPSSTAVKIICRCDSKVL